MTRLALAAFLFAPLALAAQTTTTSAPSTPDHHDSGEMPMKPRVPASHSVSVTFEGHQTTFTMDDLMKLPQVTIHVHNEHRGNIEETYTGPLLSTVLERAGLKASRETQPLILHASIIATATDHYFVLYSAAEVEPMFSSNQVIVAIMKGNMLPDEEGGLIQLVNTADTRPARWIQGLTNINVMSVTQAQ
jgi:hypothetical protein